MKITGVLNTTILENIGKYAIDRCYFEDCISALSSIPSKSIELCITDPPYNENIGSTGYRIASENSGFKHDTQYDDTLNSSDYIAFSKKWYNEVMRVSRKMLVTVGEQNVVTWIKNIAVPVDIIYHYKKNCRSPGHYAWKTVIESIFIFGEWERKQVFRTSCYDIPIETKASSSFLKSLSHPCPKCYGLWNALLRDIEYNIGKPEIILDPFLGSGTTAELAISRGIHWLGFEKKKEYEVDIEKRIVAGTERYARLHGRKTIF